MFYGVKVIFDAIDAVLGLFNEKKWLLFLTSYLHPIMIRFMTYISLMKKISELRSYVKTVLLKRNRTECGGR